MLAFPWMPEWDTDEIAGSYLSRMAKENGVASRVRFLRWLGFATNLSETQIMDVSELTPAWIALADKLEIGLNDMIRQLSTKPYWACFYRQNRRLPDSEVKILSRLPMAPELLLAMSHTRLQLRVCCECLVKDHESHTGVPILRRSHQLPGSLVCHIHGAKLLTACPGCGKVLVPRLNLVDLPPRCEGCGYDLTSHRDLRMDDLSPLLKLARFEHECLHSNFAPRPASDVAAFVTMVCHERRLRTIELLREDFGTQIGSWRRPTDTADSSRMDLREATMPTMCACLVALGFTHESAQKAIRNFAPEMPAVRKAIGSIESTSQARRIVLAKIRSGERVTWTSLQHGSRYLFWFFVLVDLAWLERKLGPRLRAGRRVPSVRKDREAILGCYSENQRRSATARANYRDREWLEATLANRREEQSRQRPFDRDAALRASINRAMTDLFARPGRPIKFTIQQAASAVGMTRATIRKLNRRDPQPRDTLFESTGHYRRRVLLWTMDELTRSDALVTPSRLLTMANVSVGTMERFWAASIVYLFGPMNVSAGSD